MTRSYTIPQVLRTELWETTAIACASPPLSVHGSGLVALVYGASIALGELLGLLVLRAIFAEMRPSVVAALQAKGA